MANLGINLFDSFDFLRNYRSQKMTQEVLKLALEYIQAVPDDRYNAEHIDRDALITAIKEALAKPERDYERGFIDGMQKQMQSSVDKAVNAMSQTEQEPVAYINVEERKLEWAKPISWNTPTTVNIPKIPLYTTPPQRTWVGLTDEEIKPCWYEACQTDLELTSQLVVYFAKAIEAKLKEKNSQHKEKNT